MQEELNQGLPTSPKPGATLSLVSTYV